MSRKKKLYLNTLSSLILQAVSFVCGFILPKFILLYYGSEVNGLVSSITRFLSIIAFMELGIGPVIQSNLYKPLAENDMLTTSKIVVSAQKFYKRIAYIFVVYIAILLFAYPKINSEFDFLFTASLLIIISISTFAQYYFGITFQVFLNADQKIYICAFTQLATIVLNTILCIVLITSGFSIHIVKLVSSLVFVLRPIMLNQYVHRYYKINYKITYEQEPIKQKWNGFAQHISSVISEEIDVILLTAFNTLENVSIYSVYFLVVHGVTQIIMTAFSGLESFWGNIIAKNEKNELIKSFDTVEFGCHFLTSFIYGAATVLIAPFISVYIKGTPDAESYYLPIFGAILVFAYGAQCLRIPYFRVIKAAGHFKQTQNGSFMSAGINVVISLILVIKFGLIGVSIGTLAAFTFHTVYLANYLRNKIINRSFKYFMKHMLVDGFIIFTVILLTRGFVLNSVDFLSWILLAIKVTIISLSITTIFNFVFFRSQFFEVLKKIIK